MEDLPTPFELANLAYTAWLHTKFNTFDEALDEALNAYRLAREKLDVASGKVVLDDHRDQFFKHNEEQPRYILDPSSLDDEVRRFLNAPSPDAGVNPRSNLKKGSTVQRKLQEFFLDRAVLRGESKEKAEHDFQWFLGVEGINSNGETTYALPVVELQHFKRWYHEVAKVTSLFRGYPKTSPVEVRVRLAMAASGFMDRERFLSLYGSEPDCQEVSRKIIGELQSLKVEKKRRSEAEKSAERGEKR